MSSIALTLASLQLQHASGELLVTHGSQHWQQWHLYLFHGRLCYATGGLHRNRRWHRALAHGRIPSLEIAMPVDGVPWELQTLKRSVESGKLTLQQARQVVAKSIEEVLFAMIGQPNLQSTWIDRSLQVQLSAMNIEQSLAGAAQLWEEWRSAGLGNLQDLLWRFSPDLAPYISDPYRLKQQVPAKTFLVLSQLLTGENTFWDIAQHFRQPLPAVTGQLMKLIYQGSVGVQELTDLPDPLPPVVAAPPVVSQPVAPVPAGVAPLIACIDDSPWVGEMMEEILTPAGYRSFSIDDPVRAFALLLQHRPQFVFLDWVMPNTNGYEFCRRLRKIQLFERVPIVILTANASIIDRVRARASGANDVMSKPPESQKVLKVLEQYLGTAPNPSGERTGVASAPVSV